MILRFWKSIAWGGMIFAISAVPGQSVPDVPIWNFDKLVHSFVYFGMTVFLYRDLCKTANRGYAGALAIAALSSIAYGGVLELLQDAVFINRSGNWVDFSANALGVLAAVALMALWKRRPGMRPAFSSSSGRV